MSIGTSLPGWFPDPTGRHQFRYFDQRWTDHVSDHGQQSFSPMAGAVPPLPSIPPSTAGPWSGAPSPVGPVPTASRRASLSQRTVVIGGSILAVIVVTVVIVVARSGSGGPTTAGADQEITGDFCADFPSNWIRIQRAHNLADDIGSSRHSVMTADDVDLLSSGISKATALAAEAPDSSIVAGVSMRKEISAVADFLGAAKKVAGAATAGGTPRLTAINNLVPDHSASMINQEVTIQAGLPGSPCPAK